jgi:lipopolysaccharide/colanic/teichoic acid biosynthesis glycosyltransferase
VAYGTTAFGGVETEVGVTVGSGQEVGSERNVGEDGGYPLAVDPIPWWKRIVDIACILLTLPAIVGVGLLVAGWILATGTGSVFYRQTRVGRGGKPFTMLKFRTMVEDAETAIHEDHVRRLMESGEVMTKLDVSGDSRIIPGGAFLRATGLDEIPQFLNVWHGEMSLVGPRPCTPKELEGYKDSHKRRFSVMPGMTGYWQVGGKNRTTFEQMIEMDLHYIARMGLFYDLALIMVTVPAILLGLGETAVAIRRRSASLKTQAPK